MTSTQTYRDATTTLSANSLSVSVNLMVAGVDESEITEQEQLLDDRLSLDPGPLSAGAPQAYWSSLTQLDVLSVSGNATFEEPRRRVPVRVAHLQDPKADTALFSSDVKRLGSILHAIVLSKATRTGFPLQEAEFGVDYDDEDDSKQVTMTFRSAANAAQAIAFWDSLSFELGRWLPSLSAHEREIVTSGISLRFAWRSHRANKR